MSLTYFYPFITELEHQLHASPLEKLPTATHIISIFVTTPEKELKVWERGGKHLLSRWENVPSFKESSRQHLVLTLLVLNIPMPVNDCYFIHQPCIKSRLSQDWVKIESRLSQDWVKIESRSSRRPMQSGGSGSGSAWKRHFLGKWKRKRKQ